MLQAGAEPHSAQGRSPGGPAPMHRLPLDLPGRPHCPPLPPLPTPFGVARGSKAANEADWRPRGLSPSHREGFLLHAIPQVRGVTEGPMSRAMDKYSVGSVVFRSRLCFLCAQLSFTRLSIVSEAL